MQIVLANDIVDQRDNWGTDFPSMSSRREVYVLYWMHFDVMYRPHRMTSALEFKPGGAITFKLEM